MQSTLASGSRNSAGASLSTNGAVVGGRSGGSRAASVSATPFVQDPTFYPPNLLADVERPIFTANFSAPSTINAITNRVLHGTMLRLTHPDMMASERRAAELVATAAKTKSDAAAKVESKKHDNGQKDADGVQIENLDDLLGGDDNVKGNGVQSKDDNNSMDPPEGFAFGKDHLKKEMDFLGKSNILTTLIADASGKVKNLLKDEIAMYTKQENAARAAEGNLKVKLGSVRANLDSTSNRLRNLEDRLATAAAATVGIEQHLSQTTARVKRGKSIGILLRYFANLDSIAPSDFITTMEVISKNREKQRLARTNEWQSHPHLVSHTNPLYFLTADPALAMLSAAAVDKGNEGLDEAAGQQNLAPRRRTVRVVTKRKTAKAGDTNISKEENEEEDENPLERNASLRLKRRKSQSRLNMAVPTSDNDEDEDDEGKEPSDNEFEHESVGGSSSESSGDSVVSDVQARAGNKKKPKSTTKKDTFATLINGGGGGSDVEDSDEEAATNLNAYRSAAGAPIRLHATELAALKMGIPRVFACRFLTENAVRRIAQLKPLVDKVPTQMQQLSGAAPGANLANDKKGGKAQSRKQAAAVAAQPLQTATAAFKKNIIEERNPNAFANITFYNAWLEAELLKEAMHLVRTYNQHYDEGGSTASVRNAARASGGMLSGAEQSAASGAEEQGARRRAASATSTPSLNPVAKGGKKIVRRSRTAGGAGPEEKGTTTRAKRVNIKAPTPATEQPTTTIKAVDTNNSRLHKTILKALEELSILYASLTGTVQGLLDIFLQTSLQDIKIALNQRLKLTPLPPAPPLPKESTFSAMDIFRSNNKMEIADFSSFLVGRTKRELTLIQGFRTNDSSASTTRKALLSQIINNGLKPFLELTVAEASKFSTDLIAQKARLSPRSEQKSRKRVNDAIAYTMSMNTALFLEAKKFGKSVSALMANYGLVADVINSGHSGGTGGPAGTFTEAVVGASAVASTFEESLVLTTIETIFGETRRTYVSQSQERVMLTSYFAESEYEYRPRLALNADEPYDYRPEAHSRKSKELVDRAKECITRALILVPPENYPTVIGELTSATIQEISKFVRKELEKTKDSLTKDARNWYEGESASKIKTHEQAYEKYIRYADSQAHVCALRLLVWAQSTLIELFDMLTAATAPIANDCPTLMVAIANDRQMYFAPVDATSEEIINLVLNAIIVRTLTIFNKLQTAKDYYNPSAKAARTATTAGGKSSVADLDQDLLLLNGNSLACATACQFLSIQLTHAMTFIKMSSLPIPKGEAEGDEGVGGGDIDQLGGGGGRGSNPTAEVNMAEYDFWGSVVSKNAKGQQGARNDASNAIYLARKAAFRASGSALSSPLVGPSASPSGSRSGLISTSAIAPLFATPAQLPYYIKALRLSEMLHPKIPTFSRVLGVSLYKGITAHLRCFMVDDVGALTYQQDVNLIRKTMEPLILSARLDGIIVGVLFDIIRETANGFMVLFDQVVPVYKSGYLNLLEYDEKVQYWRMRADMKQLFKSTGIGA